MMVRYLVWETEPGGDHWWGVARCAEDAIDALKAKSPSACVPSAMLGVARLSDEDGQQVARWYAHRRAQRGARWMPVWPADAVCE